MDRHCKAVKHQDSFAHVRNEDVDHFIPASWPTFPEKLEANNISWKIYQNEISLPSGLTSDEDAWLSNFTDNPIEFFSQYNIQYAASYREFIKNIIAVLPAEIEALKEKIKILVPGSGDLVKAQNALKEKQLWLGRAREGIDKYTAENFDKLTAQQKNIHTKAFSINNNDPNYRQLDTFKYTDDGTAREMTVPKGDVLHRFRQDVDNGTLPTVSWIVSPENFSDHPGAPWYGAWYVAEAMDILTKKPEVWKKTIFILCYDENDGYFDHVPPFVAPDPSNRSTGHVSANIDASSEYVTLAQDMKKYEEKHSRESSIGLGYRVPLVIASPWSRGGAVCSQVFDHTSIIQFIEKFVNTKFNKHIEETNITAWRRTVCGDLSSVFKPYNGEETGMPSFPARNSFMESIYNAKFKNNPAGYQSLSDAEIAAINNRMSVNGLMPVQEKGIRPACAVPYQLYADGALAIDKKTIGIKFTAGNELFGAQSAGAPFYVYANMGSDLSIRTYAASAGDTITDSWALEDFANKEYHLRLYGPNGFFRELKGNAADPLINIYIEYERIKADTKKPTGNIEISATHPGAATYTLEITDNAYRTGKHSMVTGSGKKAASLVLNLSKSFGWYDFTVTVKGNQIFEKRYAGHVETGKSSFTDPLMGGVA